MNCCFNKSVDAFKGRPTGVRTEDRDGREVHVAHMCLGQTTSYAIEYVIIEAIGDTPLRAVDRLVERVKAWTKLLNINLNEEFLPMIKADQDARVDELMKAAMAGLDTGTKPPVSSEN